MANCRYCGTNCPENGEHDRFFDCQLYTDRRPTNADRIRSMTDEELAREMLFFVPSDFNRHYTGIAGGYYATADEAIQANFDWLKQPAKEE